MAVGTRSLEAEKVAECCSVLWRVVNSRRQGPAFLPPTCFADAEPKLLVLSRNASPRSPRSPPSFVTPLGGLYWLYRHLPFVDDSNPPTWRWRSSPPSASRRQNPT
jgi:hypothetical protein